MLVFYGYTGLNGGGKQKYQQFTADLVAPAGLTEVRAQKTAVVKPLLIYNKAIHVIVEYLNLTQIL